MPAKVLETPKAKQTEVDYKAKIDAVIAGFTTKARHTHHAPRRHSAWCLPPATLTLLGLLCCCSQVNKQGEEMSHKCKVCTS